MQIDQPGVQGLPPRLPLPINLLTQSLSPEITTNFVLKAKSCEGGIVRVLRSANMDKWSAMDHCDAESEFNLEAQVRTDAGWGGRAASNENEPEGDGTGRCVITGSTRSMISYHHHRSPPLTTTIHHIRPTNVTTTHSTSPLFFIAIATTTCDTDGYLVHHNPPAPPLASRLHQSTLLHIHTPNTIRLPAKPPSSSSSSSSTNCYPPPSFRTTPRHRAPPRSVNDPRVQVQAIHGGDVRTGVPVRLRRRGCRSAAQRDVHQACVHPKLPYMTHPAFRSYTLARPLTACVPVHLVVICAGLALLLGCITRPLQDGPSRFSHGTCSLPSLPAHRSAPLPLSLPARFPLHAYLSLPTSPSISLPAKLYIPYLIWVKAHAAAHIWRDSGKAGIQLSR